MRLIKCFYALAAAVLLSVSAGITVSTLAAAPESPDSATNDKSAHNMLEERLARARKRGKATEESDALYDLAKACFEGGEVSQAEKYMREALQVEAGLHRPQDLIRIRVALASLLVAQKKRADAFAIYQDALDLAQGQHLNDQAAIIIDSMGALALISGRLDEAEKLFQQARTLAVESKSVASQSSVLVNLAVVARARHNDSEALELLKQAVALVQDQREKRVLAAALMELGRTQADLGHIDESAAALRQAAELYQSELEPVWRGKALLSLGRILLDSGKPTEAEAAFRDAGESFREEKFLPGLMDSQIGLGAARAASGDFRQSDTTLQEAMRLARASGNTSKQRAILSEIAYADFQHGLPEKALNNYLEAYALLQKQDKDDARTKAVLLSDIAMTYRAIGQQSAAIKYYEQSLSAFDQSNDLEGKAVAANSLAVAYLDNDMPQEFDKYYQLSKAAFLLLKDQRGVATLTYNRAQFEMMLGHYADAIPLYEEALGGMRTAGDTKGAGQVLRSMALAYLCMGRSGKALELYQQALPIAQESGNIEAQWDCELGLGKSYKLLGQLDEALPHLQKAVELVDQERRQLSRDASKTFSMDLRRECFTELIDVLVKKNQIATALEMAERSRARAFLDLLEGRRSRLPNELASVAPADSGAAPKLVPGAQTGTRAVEVVPRAAAVVEASAISSVNALPPSLDEIKALVHQSNCDFIEYYILPDRILTWIIHPNGEIQLAPPVILSRQQLEKQVAAAYQAIVAQSAGTQQNTQTREKGLKDLYKLLIEPAVPFLSKQPDAAITIIPHGQLFSVPYAALLAPNSHFLVEDYTLSFAPAIGVLRATQQLHDEAKKQTDNLLGFGNPITKQIEFLGALPFSEKEVKHISELFGPGKTTVKIGEQASKPEFKDLAPRFKYLHLATHGLIDELHPMDSALVLAPSKSDDGLLTVKDILQLPSLKSRLVVLSACQTGRGKITGDGVIGLSRSFIVAGTPSIVVSQWNVDDVMTEYQMTSFYKELLQGTGLAKSLRQAQLKTISFMERLAPASTTKSRANPRLWAAFQLMGEAQ